jgi:hypothetical protein
MKSSPMSGNRSGAVSFVCLAVCALSVFTVLNSMQPTKTWAEQYPDAYGAARAESRFAPLLARVATNAELGYFTDLEPTHQAYSAAFLAAQYAIAPRQLVMISPQARPEWAVGNFTKLIDFASVGAAQGYDISMDFGNGVVLFHRKPTK